MPGASGASRRCAGLAPASWLRRRLTCWLFYLVILLLYSPLLTLIGLANVAVCLVIIFLSNRAHDLQDELAAFVALDLSGVNYLSAACMQTLLAIQQKIDERGGRLLLIMQKRSGRRTRNSAQYWIH